MKNLTQRAVDAGGRLSSLIIKEETEQKIALMNPSVFVDQDGDVLVNIRNTNYFLYHSDGKQYFPCRWGFLEYLHPENDMHLRTTNYICRLDSNLKVVDYTKVDTSLLDTGSDWDFIGLEDARLVAWQDSYYLAGVRRDVSPNGEGRIELSRIELDKESWTAKEVSRFRIPPPIDQNSYCEKNWVPILNNPYHFVKWTSPTEIVKTYPEEPARCEQVLLSNSIRTNADLRGSSHVVMWKDKYISISHEVYFVNDYLGRKDGIYRHRLVVWDSNFTLLGMSPESFSFLEGRIEFCAGAAVLGSDLLASFSFSDNAAFVLQIPESVVDEMVEEAVSYV